MSTDFLLLKMEVKKMSELGVIASQLDENRKSLREFDEALRIVKKQRDISRSPKTQETIEKLLNVLRPIADGIKKRFSESTAITERSIIQIIMKRHYKDWHTFKKSILRLEYLLNSEKKFSLAEDDLIVLNDIADALDAECTNLFHRMGEGR